MKRRAFLSGAALAVTGHAIGAEQSVVTPASGTINEKPRNTPVVQTVDVCVLGGSCTGVFAAVRAAQTGAKVAIIEKQNAFGGVATSGLVAIWHRLEDRKKKETIIGGLTKTMIDRLTKLNACNTKGFGRSYNLNTEELKIELDKLAGDHNITPYLHTYYASPLIENGKIQAVFIENKNGRQAIRAKVFIDATGDGDLSKDMGIPFAIRKGLQPPTTCSNIQGLPGNIQQLMRKHGKEFGLVKDNGWGTRIPGTKDVSMCALTHVFNTDASDAKQLTAAEIEGRRQVRAYMDIARKYGGKNNTPALLDLGSYIGIRETRSFTANYTLTEQDILSCKRFPDAIANGSYHIDVHDPKTGKFKFKEPRGAFYQIPLSTMVSNKADNVVMAGRMISTDRSAFGAIRVMVNLNQVGEAAGVTAALAVSGKKAVSKVDSAAVRKQLSKLGAVII
ncbi:MAG: FAD-dependent oxidoreductase [Phycisphaerales bacterium]|nr:FAD-dependent oxidoreductase [Phycisphaerales bacterium]